jgi:hypothetical protein
LSHERLEIEVCREGVILLCEILEDNNSSRRQETLKM